jgi:hypothetical protein
VQVAAGEKLATPLLVHAIVPLGESPETLAVHVVVEPVAAGDGVHRTVSVVTSLPAESE